jgi:hypothetical protein
MVDWLRERQSAGDSIAQHGFHHQQLRRAAWSPRRLTPGGNGRAAEFVGLDGAETRRAVSAGWRVLKLAGIEPDGFVAPAYAYTPELRSIASSRFRWWAGLLRLHGAVAEDERAAGNAQRPQRFAPAWGMGTGSPLQRALSPALIRTGAILSGQTLRLDLHPGVLQSPSHMLALEWVLVRAAERRVAVTYDELLRAESSPASYAATGSKSVSELSMSSAANR